MHINFMDIVKVTAWMLVIPLMVVIFRFDDIRASFFLETLHFETVLGKIVSSKVDHSGGWLKSAYKYKVRYVYQVDDQEYESTRVHFGAKRFREKQKALEVVEKYPVDSEVIVYFQSSQPESSVLDPHTHSRENFIWIFSVLGALLVLVPFFMFCVALRSKRTNKRVKPGPTVSY